MEPQPDEPQATLKKSEQFSIKFKAKQVSDKQIAQWDK